MEVLRGCVGMGVIFVPVQVYRSPVAMRREKLFYYALLSACSIDTHAANRTHS